MNRRRIAFSALFLLTSLVVAACTPETVRVTASPAVAATSAAPTTPAPTATRTPTPPPTTAAPTASPTAAPTTSPGSTPPVACATLSGGSPLAASRLTAIRAAHQPGFDRLVFEFSGPAVPDYLIELASSFTATSGQPVRVDGNAFFKVRFGGQAHNDAGQRSYPQPDPYRVGLIVVREIKLVEDFEGVILFGVGMERLVCPTVLTLLGATRVVIDFPTPP
ncbi:MAG: hypothetical protein Q7S41_00760 [Candidatus Limnocylindria bacterium]|nr:hypothetical protein [Candidatus Limnocylindria bacterium]